MFASLWIIPIFTLIVAFLMYGGLTRLLLLGAPHSVLLPALGVSVVVYGLLEAIARVLERLGLFNVWNHFAACAVISFAFGFMPLPLLAGNARGPLEILLEEYASVQTIYVTFLYAMAGIWWLSYTFRRTAK